MAIIFRRKFLSTLNTPNNEKRFTKIYFSPHALTGTHTAVHTQSAESTGGGVSWRESLYSEVFPKRCVPVTKFTSVLRPDISFVREPVRAGRLLSLFAERPPRIRNTLTLPGSRRRGVFCCDRAAARLSQ